MGIFDKLRKKKPADPNAAKKEKGHEGHDHPHDDGHHHGHEGPSHAGHKH